MNCKVCGRQFKWKSHLTEHTKVHSNVRAFECTICAFRFKNKSHLKGHMKVHSDARDFECTLCKAKFKRRKNLNEHMQTHRNARSYRCSCGKAFNVRASLCRHQQHCSNERKHRCECGATFNVRPDLLRHQESVHDIGIYKCDYCLGNRNSRIDFTDPVVGAVSLCKACFKKTTGAGSRVELEWREYVDKNIGTDGLIATDQALKSVGGCSRKRPDRLYADPLHVEIGEAAAMGQSKPALTRALDECDEHMHANYRCEEGRLMEIYNDFFGKPVVVVRWNPHRTKNIKTPLQTRLELFVALKRAIRRQRRGIDPDTAPRIIVYYMFFEKDCPSICREIESVHIDSAGDIEAINKD